MAEAMRVAAGSQQPSGSLVPGMAGVDMGDMLGALEGVQDSQPIKIEAAKARDTKALTLPLPLILTLTPPLPLTFPKAFAHPRLEQMDQRELARPESPPVSMPQSGTSDGRASARDPTSPITGTSPAG